MGVSSIKSSVVKINGLSSAQNRGVCTAKGFAANKNGKVVSFGMNTNAPKYFWLYLKKLSNYMKEPSEMTNALIAMIGTGLIAPFAIMCSPKKKGNQSAGDEKTDKEKKFFQALRQPVSAFLQFAFQVPTTVGIAMGLNHMAYKQHRKFFNDEKLGTIIPSKSYLGDEAKKILAGKASPELQKQWEPELKIAEDKAKLKADLMKELKEEYKEVHIDISDKKLEELANSERRMKKFTAEKMAKARHERMIDEKVAELSKKYPEFTELDMVTADYKRNARQTFKSDFESLEKNAKLNLFDRFLRTMGLSNKKLKKLEDSEKNMEKEKGLALMKKEIPEVFNDSKAKLRKFVESRDVKAQKLFKNKIFWISLVTNLFMVAFSCVALNWLHPKFAALVDKIREKKEDKPSPDKKVEVKA